MPLFQWSQNLSVNIAEIDTQHKRLVDLINQLHDSMKEGKGKEALGKILKELTDYTVYHFSTEEKLFEKHGYPEGARHKKEHEDLTRQVLDIGGKFSTGKAVITMEVMNFLKEWLNNHIMQVDKKYSQFLNAKGVH